MSLEGAIVYKDIFKKKKTNVSTALLFQYNIYIKYQVQEVFNIIYISVARNARCHNCKAWAKLFIKS